MIGTLVGVVMTARTADITWLFLTLPFLLVLLAARRFAPTAYWLARDGLHIERRGGPKVIPYAAIHTVDRAPRSIGGLTAVGSNGLFGRFGTFWSPRLGTYRLFITNTDRLVWLATDGGLVAVSPDRPDDF
ncbi:MAG TPA: PH domain-containing protein, partial [Terriglobales bacterium]|nr:PH domain-containing protein [Terriglobales bacterium]